MEDYAMLRSFTFLEQQRGDLLQVGCLLNYSQSLRQYFEVSAATREI